MSHWACPNRLDPIKVEKGVHDLQLCGKNQSHASSDVSQGNSLKDGKGMCHGRHRRETSWENPHNDCSDEAHHDAAGPIEGRFVTSLRPTSKSERQAFALTIFYSDTPYKVSTFFCEKINFLTLVPFDRRPSGKTSIRSLPQIVPIGPFRGNAKSANKSFALFTES